MKKQHKACFWPREYNFSFLWQPLFGHMPNYEGWGDVYSGNFPPTHVQVWSQNLFSLEICFKASIQCLARFWMPQGPQFRPWDKFARTVEVCTFSWLWKFHWKSPRNVIFPHSFHQNMTGSKNSNSLRVSFCPLHSLPSVSKKWFFHQPGTVYFVWFLITHL